MHGLKIFSRVVVPQNARPFALLSAINSRVHRQLEPARRCMHLSSSSEEDFTALMREYRKQASPRKLLSTVEQHASTGQLTPNMTLIAFKTLHRMNRTDLSPSILPHWIKAVDSCRANSISCDVSTTTTMLHMYCKLQMMDSAEAVANSVGIYIDGKETVMHNSSESIAPLNPSAVDLYRQLLPELSLGFISIGSQFKSLAALDMMSARGLDIEADMSKRILRQYFAHSKSDTIRKAIKALLALNGLDDNDSIQLITNNYLRSVDFVKGAVSVETLPDPECPEVAFIGRSNVGKSSLINMVCNRKGLAYTSKTPGKTSEFNYFDAKGLIGPNKEPHRFFLVDLPGVGYARKNVEMRKGWTKLLQEYVSQRATLRTVFHLVDSRHGLLEADEECLSLLGSLPPHVQYVIVLTKVDKQGTSEKFTSALTGIIDRIYSEVSKRTSTVVPIILTSSENKQGGTAMLAQILNDVAYSHSENNL